MLGDGLGRGASVLRAGMCVRGQVVGYVTPSMLSSQQKMVSRNNKMLSNQHKMYIKQNSSSFYIDYLRR